MAVIDLHPLTAFPEADLHGRLAPGCKGTTLGHIQQIDGGAGDGLQPLTIIVHRGNGAHQALGVLMLGVIEDLISSTLLTDGAGIFAAIFFGVTSDASQ